MKAMELAVGSNGLLVKNRRYTHWPGRELMLLILTIRLFSVSG